jgi:predicted metal-dependent RNase
MNLSTRRAGHVLGAAMFMIEIKGMRCLYTGDYSRVPDRHMPAADLPMIPPHIIIVESTFGTSDHLPREDRERNFQNKVLPSAAFILLPESTNILLFMGREWTRTRFLSEHSSWQCTNQAGK